MAKILFVIPMKEMENLVLDTIEEYKNYYSYNFNEKMDFEIDLVVKKFGEEIDVNSYNSDIIVSRGYNAITLRKLYPDIPVVEIPITIMDVVLSAQKIQKASIDNEPIALLGIGNFSFQAQIASQLCNMSITPYKFGPDTILTDKSISLFIDELSSKGFKHVIGGIRMVNIANSKNLTSAFIECGYESIWLAIGEACHIAGIRRKERERAAHFQTILNHSHEGIISTDINNNIIHINSSACKILDTNVSSCIGNSIKNIIPDSKFVAMLNDKEDCSDELINIKNSKIILSKVGTTLGNEMIGNVITFQKISNVQNTEFKIRNKLYSKGLVAKYSFNHIIGSNASLTKTVDKAKIFAKAPSNVLIVGATGTGKELFAQSIHNYSNRKNGPFVAVNCAAIPENLMESEFLGYAPGAFTGASKEGKMGFFELAHEGTIFLDEVSEIPLNLQGKLLRVIQESEVMRIGYDKIIPINIRIICATNKDLKTLVKEGKFRDDLYYRLCVLQLQLPPLLDREQDVILLANHFISIYCSDFSKNNITLSSDAQNLLLHYSWDGNIRELRNICEQLVVLNKTGIISAEEVSTILPITTAEEIKAPSKLSTVPSTFSSSNNFFSDRKQYEKDLVINALKECNYNKTKAATLLGMNRTTLWKKLKEYNIECKTTII